MFRASCGFSGMCAIGCIDIGFTVCISEAEQTGSPADNLSERDQSVALELAPPIGRPLYLCRITLPHIIRQMPEAFVGPERLAL